MRPPRRNVQSQEWSSTGGKGRHCWDLGENNEFPVPRLWAFLLLSTPQYHVTRHSLSMLWVERAPRSPSHKGVPWVLDFLLGTLRPTWVVRAPSVHQALEDKLIP